MKKWKSIAQDVTEFDNSERKIIFYEMTFLCLFYIFIILSFDVLFDHGEVHLVQLKMNSQKIAKWRSFLKKIYGN